MNFAKSVGLTRLDLSCLPVALDCPAEDFVTEFYHMLFDYTQLVISALPFDLPRLVLNKIDDANKINHAKQIALSSLTNLRVLHLISNQIGGVGLSSSSLLTNLCELHLAANQISDAGLSSLSRFTNLHTLELSHIKTGDAGLTALSRLTNLNKLKLSYNQIGDAGKVVLKQALTSLQDMHI